MMPETSWEFRAPVCRVLADKLRNDQPLFRPPGREFHGLKSSFHYCRRVEPLDRFLSKLFHCPSVYSLMMAICRDWVYHSLLDPASPCGGRRCKSAAVAGMNSMTSARMAVRGHGFGGSVRKVLMIKGIERWAGQSAPRLPSSAP